MKNLVCLFLLVVFSPQIDAQNLEPHSKKHLILKFKTEQAEKFKNLVSLTKFNDPQLDLITKSSKALSIKLTGNRSKADTYLLTFEGDQNIQNLISQFSATNLFEYVEPNFIGMGAGVKGISSTIPNDFKFSKQWGFVNDGTFNLSPATIGADVEMDLAWDIEKGDSTLIVAVLDAGLKLDHPEMADRLWINPNDTADGADEDNNSYVDDINGWDFANDDNLPKDDHGHGTNVTGIIGAMPDNSIGYAGVDWHCKIMTGKILNASNFGQYDWFADGIYYAVDNGAKLINMSVGGSGFSQLMSDAVDYAYQNGVTIVACMMNFNNQTTYYPAGYQKTIAVGSTNSNDERTAPFFWDPTSGSNYGNHIDVVAPGNYIYGLSHISNSNYNSYWGGTSQATPLVTGICALLLAQDPTRGTEDLRSILRSTAEDEVGKSSEDVPGFDIYHGTGRVNAFQALKLEAVGLNESLELDMKFQVYPNPSRDEISVNSKSPFSKLSIFNSLGQRVLNLEENNSFKTKIEVSHFSKGIYFINLYDDEGQFIGSKKLLIEN